MPVWGLEPKGSHLGVCACPPGTQENYTSNKSPARELSDGTKIFGVPGRERGFFYKSSSLVKYNAVLSIFSAQWPIKGPNAPRSRTRVPGPGAARDPGLKCRDQPSSSEQPGFRGPVLFPGWDFGAGSISTPGFSL